jgi:hypothetical protein
MRSLFGDQKSRSYTADLSLCQARNSNFGLQASYRVVLYFVMKRDVHHPCSGSEHIVFENKS